MRMCVCARRHVHVHVHVCGYMCTPIMLLCLYSFVPVRNTMLRAFFSLNILLKYDILKYLLTDFME